MSTLATPATFTATGGLNIDTSSAAIAAQAGAKSFTADGKLRATITVPTSITWVHGLPFNDSGELVVVDSSSATGTYRANGILLSASGAVVCVSEGGAVGPIVEAQGLKFDAAGAVLVEGLSGLSLNFLSDTLDPRATFSRASNATMVDSLGRIVWAPHNLHRFSSDPTNWSVSGVAVVQNNTDGPFVGATVGEVYDTASFQIHTLNFTAVAGTYVSGQQVTYTVYLKAGTLSYALIALTSSFTLASIGIDLTSGVISAGTGAFDSQEIVDAGNGWWRVIVTSTATGSAAVTGTFLTYCSQDGVWGNRNYTGTGTDYIRVSSPQVELTDAATPRPYYATSGASAYYGPRLDYNPVTLAPRGLHAEESRTNLLNDGTTWTAAASVATVTKNAIDIFDIANAAFTLDGSSTVGFQMATSSLTTVTAAQHAISAYVKPGTATRCQLAVSSSLSTESANFSLVGSGSVLRQNPSSTATIERGPLGYYRISMAITPSAATNTVFVAHINSDSASRLPSFDASGLSLSVCWGQVEPGAFPTSLIPTYGAAATRAADLPDAAIVGAASYTLMVDFEPGTLATSSKSAASIFADFNNYTRIIQTASIAAQSGIDGVLLTGGTGAVVLIPTKVAVAISPGQMLTARDGALTDTDSGATFDASAITTLNIGRNGSISTPLNGWVRQVKYYQTALTAAQLEAVTA